MLEKFLILQYLCEHHRYVPMGCSPHSGLAPWVDKPLRGTPSLGDLT
jgi:hypothetical protein